MDTEWNAQLLSNILYRANEKTSKKRKATTETAADRRVLLKEIIEAGDVPESANLIPKLKDKQVKVFLKMANMVNENLDHVRIFDIADVHCIVCISGVRIPKLKDVHKRYFFAIYVFIYQIQCTMRIQTPKVTLCSSIRDNVSLIIPP